MSYTNKDWLNAITRLIEKTSKGEYKWRLTDKFREDPYEETDSAYELWIKLNRYVVRCVKIREYFSEEPNDYMWSGGFHRLEIYHDDEQGRPVKVAVAPQLDAVRDLFLKVQASYAFNQGILDDLLKGEDD